MSNGNNHQYYQTSLTLGNTTWAFSDGINQNQPTK